MRVLTLWCPDWPVTAAGFEPDDPVAVVHANRVVSASAAARATGVRAGLRRREAQSRCAGLVVVGEDLPGQARAFEPVVAAVTALTPRVEVTRPGLLALDARGPARFLGGEGALCRRVADEAASALGGAGVRGPAPGVGIADGRFAAGLAARRGEVVPIGANRAFLADFPTAVLGDPELADLLVRLGITTVGAFADLPTPSVLARFGAGAARLHAVALGRDEELLDATAPEAEPSAEADFDPPVERVDRAAFAGRAVAAELADRLGRQGLVCTRLRIEIETEHAESMVRVWRDDEGIGAEAMVERLRWQFGGWLSGTAVGGVPTGGVTLLRMVADEVAGAGSRQAGFWGGTSHADRRAGRGLDRLRGMLGPGAVFTGALAGGRGPVDRARLVPWGEPAPGRPELPWPGHHPLPAPALVHPAPLAAEVVGADGAPVTVSARGHPSAAPVRLSIAGGPWAEVAGWAGPWTLDERWWDRRARRRRARFQLVAGEGAHLCTVEDARWWVEATYD